MKSFNTRNERNSSRKSKIKKVEGETVPPLLCLFLHRPTILCLCGRLCICNKCIGLIKLAKLKPRLGLLKTDLNEMKTHKIAAMLFYYVFFLCVCVYALNDVFKIPVGLLSSVSKA